MFDVSLTELMVIGVVALIVIGPERLPKVARTVGHLLGRAQRYVNDVKSDIQREIELDELRKFKSEMETAAQGVQKSLHETQASLEEPVQQLRASWTKRPARSTASLRRSARRRRVRGAARADACRRFACRRFACRRIACRRIACRRVACRSARHRTRAHHRAARAEPQSGPGPRPRAGTGHRARHAGGQRTRARRQARHAPGTPT